MKQNLQTISFKIVFIISILFSSTNTFAYNDNNPIKYHINLSETYDDNIGYVRTNKKEDYITKASLGIIANYSAKNKSFDLSGNIHKQFYSKNTNFDNDFHDILLNFQNELSKFDLIKIRNQFSNTYEPRNFEDAFGRTSGKYSINKNMFNFEYLRDISRQSSISTKYYNEATNYSKANMTSSYLNGISIANNYSLNFTTNLLFSYEYQQRHFSTNYNNFTQSLAIGITKYINTQNYINLKTGVDFITAVNSKEFIQSSLNASFVNESSQTSKTDISFSKQSVSTSYSQDLFDRWQVSSNFTKQLLEKVGCSISGFYGDGKYLTADIDEKNFGASFNLTFNLKENLNGNLSYNHSETESSIKNSGYVKNKFLLGLNMEF